MGDNFVTDDLNLSQKNTDIKILSKFPSHYNRLRAWTTNLSLIYPGRAANDCR